MKTKSLVRNSIVLLIVLCNVGCDQISKSIVRQEINYNESVKFINNHFTLTKVENTGAFLSLGNSLPYFVKLIFLSILPVFVIFFGIYLLMSKSNLSRMLILGFCFIIGGGIGNLYDRIIHGSVTDFMHIDFILFQTGIFNMADVSIMIGTAIVLFDVYLKKIAIKPAL
ncbi:MAG: signal peptidase II [Pelobium sp.]